MDTYRIPHYKLNILAKRIVEMLSHVEIDEITEMMKHIHTYNTRTHNYT